MTQVTQYILPALGIGRKIIDLPTTDAIHKLSVYGSFVTAGAVEPTLTQWATYVSKIEILLDGHSVWNVSMASYVAWLKYHNVTTEDGVLPLLFMRPWEDILAARNHGILGTADLDKVQVAFTFLTAEINDLQMHGEVSANERIGQFYGFTERPLTLASTGDHDLTDFPHGKDYATTAIHFNIATIEQIRIYIGSKEVDDTSRRVRLQQQRDNGKAQQAGFTHLDFARSGDVRGVWPMKAKDVRFRVTTSDTPGAIIALHEYLQNFSQIRRALA